MYIQRQGIAKSQSTNQTQTVVIPYTCGQQQHPQHGHRSH